FVPLPFSCGSNDDDFVSERFAGAEIVLPIFRHKKLEHRMRPEAQSRWAGETDQARSEPIRDQFGISGLCHSAGRKRKVSSCRILALAKGDAILCPAHDPVV